MLATLAFPLLLAIPVSAQQILQFGSGQLPTCAQTCTALVSAQQACVPVPATEKSCFCQSAYLTQQTGNLFNDANAVCTQQCPNQSDRNQIQSWYRSYCGSGTESSGQTSSSAAGPSPTSAAPTSTASASGKPFQIQQGQEPSWWSEHAKWIAMVIVLVIAFALIIVFGVWWKRRHDRKVNRATEDPLPDGWGPPSDPHTYAAGGAVTEKKRSTVSTKPQQHDVEMGKARKLKKLLGR